MRRALNLGLIALGGAAQAVPPTPRLPMPTVRAVPDDGQLPLASARYRQGAEYADLDAAGYVEEEYYLSGKADAVNAADGAAVAAQPYVTRILVRRPKNAARFSGTAVVEPFSFAGERAGGWTKLREHLLRHGDAWIGITLLAGDTPTHGPAGPQGLQQLKSYDPARYAPLAMFEGAPGEFMRATSFSKGVLQPDSFAPQGVMILGELAQLVKSNGAGSPLKGLKVERFYTLTWQVQSQLWVDYLKQGRARQWRLPNGRALIDGYMLGNYSGNLPLPADIPVDEPVVIVRSGREIANNARDGVVAVPDGPDTKGKLRLRVYDFNGSAHIGTRDVGSGSLQIAERSHGAGPAGPPPRPGRAEVCTSGLAYDEPVEPVITAIYADMDGWVRGGKPMPPSSLSAVSQGATVKDADTGIAQGGLRPPWVEVPTARYLVGDEVGCGAMDVKVPYDTAALRARYGTYAAYADAFVRARQRFASAGFLLPEDRDRLRPVATAAAFGEDHDH